MFNMEERILMCLASEIENEQFRFGIFSSSIGLPAFYERGELLAVECAWCWFTFLSVHLVCVCNLSVLDVGAMQ